MRRSTRQRTFLLMVSTLVWVVTQVAMVGMGVGDASAAPTSAKIGPVEAEFSTVDSTRTAASGSHGAPAGDNSPASPVSHRLCPWCAQNAGIGPVQGGFSHLPQPQDSSGDLVFARTGASVGKSYLYDRKDGELIFAGFLIKIRPDPNILKPHYLFELTKTRAYWNWVSVMSMRSGQPGINGLEYEQFQFHLPPPKEQTAIAAVLSDMDGEIAALERRLAKTRDLKQAMMQELLTGRTRLV